MTKRVIKEEKAIASVHKLGNLMTFMSLFKGFIISSPVYTPKSFRNAGYMMSSIMQVISAIYTGYCGVLLLEIKEKTGLTSYSRIGE